MMSRSRDGLVMGTKNKEKMEECSRYNRCSAPLCPLDAKLRLRKWYPDEPYCSRTDIRPGWVNVQQRIQRKALNREMYFTVDMLNEIEKVYKGIKGIESDKETDASRSVEDWNRKYRKKRKEAKERYRERGCIFKK